MFKNIGFRQLESRDCKRENYMYKIAGGRVGDYPDSYTVAVMHKNIVPRISCLCAFI